MDAENRKAGINSVRRDGIDTRVYIYINILAGIAAADEIEADNLDDMMKLRAQV